MLEKPLVFVDIDTQRDFLDRAGALYVRGGAEILPNLRRLTEFAHNHKIPILATACAHHRDDRELTQFPPHCMAGTIGQQRVAETACADSVVLDVDDRLSDGIGIPSHLTLFKRELDIFSRPDADELVALYNQNKPAFVVYGVATDYCVRAAVQGLLARHCHVAIVADAVRAIDGSAESLILTEFVRKGACLTVTEVICRGLAA